MRSIKAGLGLGLGAGIALAVSLTTGCRPREAVYSVRGTIRELKPDGTNVVIAHDKIAGYMDAMTMNFDTQAASALQGRIEALRVSLRAPSAITIRSGVPNPATP